MAQSAKIMRKNILKKIVSDQKIRAVSCMGFCEHHEVVAFQGKGRETLVFGPLISNKDEDDIIEGFQKYCSFKQGEKMMKHDRPHALKETVLARIPAMLDEVEKRR